MASRPLICATVTASTMADLVIARDAVSDADMVEMRLDTVADPDVWAALRQRKTPVIVTCRCRAEGGQFAGSEEARRALLMAALEAGAEYVDLEWRSDFDEVVRARGGRNIVLSHHDFTGVPADLGARLDAMLATPAAVVKVAVKATRLADCLTLRDQSRRHPDRSLVLIGMGDAGLPTRVFAARFGSLWTYVGDAVAPGQVAVDRLVGEWAFTRITDVTRVYGLFGRDVAHSPSPAMHNAGFASLGIDAAYIPLCAADADDAMAFARGFKIDGASVTMPFKVEMQARLDDSDDRARAVGAVNTLAQRQGRWVGTNTDGQGFLAGLEGMTLAGARAAVLGTGGAARAVAVALRDQGARVTVYGRSAGRTIEMANACRVAGCQRPVPPASWDILVNATPVGTAPHVNDTAFPEDRYDGAAVYDLVYRPEATRLLRDAAAAGCRTVSGLTMLIEQARQQQLWWTGRMPDIAVMRTAAVDALAKRTRDV
jgi:3-dehydroquinate dehydratase/shikimate dehydrogenase